MNETDETDETGNDPSSEVKYQTVAAWVRVPDTAREAAREAGVDFRAGSHAATHAVINALPLYLMASQSDVGAECGHDDGHYRPRRLLIYDRHPGGVGIARQAAPIFMELLRAAVELVEGCGCGDGVGGGGVGGGAGGGGRGVGVDSQTQDEDNNCCAPSKGPAAATRQDADADADEEDAVEEDGGGDAVDQTGCPGCVHYLSCDQYNAVLDKRGALVILRATIEAEERAFAPVADAAAEEAQEEEVREEAGVGGDEPPPEEAAGDGGGGGEGFLFPDIAMGCDDVESRGVGCASCGGDGGCGDHQDRARRRRVRGEEKKKKTLTETLEVVARRRY